MPPEWEERAAKRAAAAAAVKSIICLKNLSKEHIFPVAPGDTPGAECLTRKSKKEALYHGPAATGDWWQGINCSGNDG